MSGGSNNKPRGAAECLAKFLSLPLEKQEAGKAPEGGAGGASEWVRGLAAGVDGQGACVRVFVCEVTWRHGRIGDRGGRGGRNRLVS